MACNGDHPADCGCDECHACGQPAVQQTREGIWLRCSALPLAYLCAGSVRDGGLRVDPVHEAAGAGSAAHEAMPSLVETSAVEWDRIDEIAANHGADPSEVRMLVALGAKLWATVRHFFPLSATEVPLSAEVTPGVMLTGHADVCTTIGDIAHVADWKTGRVDKSYREQMLGYAALVILNDADVTEAQTMILWVRDGDVEQYTLRRADLDAWRQRLISTVVEWDGTYRPGSHCHGCPRAHDCPAARSLVRRDVAALIGAEEPIDLSALTPAQKVALHEVERRVAQLAARVHEAIVQDVREHGAIEADGVRLALETREVRELDPAGAWPVLEAQGFADEDFAAVMDLRLGRIEKRVAERAGIGKGASAVRALREQLEAAGAVRRREEQRLERRRT